MLQQYEIQAQTQEVLKYKLLDARKIKKDVDRLAIEAGLNGIAYPAEGTLSYARQHGLEPEIINACCGVNWN